MVTLKRKYAISRRYGTTIWADDKDPVISRNYPPGQHGPIGYKRLSTYGKQLKTIRQLQTHYGISAKQLQLFFVRAKNMKGDVIVNFLRMLESRLDMVVFRSKFAPSIRSARQMVSHGCFTVNNNKVNIPSYLVKVGDVLTIREKFHNMELIQKAKGIASRVSPDYVNVDHDKHQTTLSFLPSGSDIPYPFIVDMNLVIAFYSRLC